ncbi:claspin-like isoform X2 [Anthonomus grandis grandis]|uniref:claspin-like isoform X2 n=1 Tax=Anthonomus grandis grandis TaxID=2921223 RepID=UPI0021650AC2|nr:claspin-like isoform X2 [Anthonomus grandis grandis]
MRTVIGMSDKINMEPSSCSNIAIIEQFDSPDIDSHQQYEIRLTSTTENDNNDFNSPQKLNSPEKSDQLNSTDETNISNKLRNIQSNLTLSKVPNNEVTSTNTIEQFDSNDTSCDQRLRNTTDTVKKGNSYRNALKVTLTEIIEPFNSSDEITNDLRIIQNNDKAIIDKIGTSTGIIEPFSSSDINVAEHTCLSRTSDELCNVNSNESNIPNKSKIKRLVLNIDSEDNEETQINDMIDTDELPVIASSINLGQRRRIKAIVDSDSEEDETSVRHTLHNESFDKHNEASNSSVSLEEVNRDAETQNVKPAQKNRKIAIIDSDSEGEEDIIKSTLYNKSLDYIDENRANVLIDNQEEDMKLMPKKSRLAMLCDSDSEGEEREQAESAQNSSDNEIVEETQYQTLTSKNKKPIKSHSKNAAKKAKINSNLTDSEDIPKITNAREAAEQRKLIQSESQRMLREKNISLPYHKPKTHSLQDFLARRPKLSQAASVIGRAPPSVAIKMTTEQLEIISKRLKEREKEVKEFYKSESESDAEEDDQEYKPPSKDVNSEAENKVEDIDPVSASIENDEISSTDEKNDNKQITSTESPSIIRETESLNMVQENRSLEVQGQQSDSSTQEQLISGSNEMPMEVEESSKISMQENIPFNDITTESHDKQTCQQSESYEFQLDDEEIESPMETPENISKSIVENESLVTCQEFNYSDLDKEIEAYRETEPRERPSIKSKLELLKEQLANDKPKLSGCPDEIIDLDSGVTKPREVVQLMERFAKHVATKKHHSKHKVKLSIVTVESGGDIHEEEVAVNVDSDEEAAEVEEKPGAKLHKLKEELQKQMEQKKTEIWRKKAAKGIRGGLFGSEEGEEETEEKYIFDDEEEEMTEEEETGEELEENVNLDDKPKKKSMFMDEEAEVSENDDMDEPKDKEGYEEDIPGDDEINAEQSEEENKEDEASDAEDDASVISEASEKNAETFIEKKRVLKRIVQPADDDSDDDDLFKDDVQKNDCNEVHLDSTITADEDDIPPHQPPQLRTPIRPAISQTKSIGDFLTPISFITSIQNLASASKIKDGPVISPFKMPSDVPQSPFKEDNSVRQKKLFADSEILESQGSVEMLASQLESSSEQYKSTETLPSHEATSGTSEEPPSTQDLLAICSGEFTGVTQPEFASAESTKQLIDFTSTQSSELKCLGQEDTIISQLLDEEELENFKKKFDSPVNAASQRNIFADSEEIKGGGIIDSDDDDDVDGATKIKKTNKKRLQFLDDDSSEDSESEEEFLEDKENMENIDYDSEENEIDLDDEDVPQKAPKLADFLEAEAELSESEWGSEDEDEKDLDQLEFELGDTEKFDEEKVKSDLEKIHMRRMLDDDNREVKLLQELLLEDGEMHGTGRQRQFKWKNIDLNGDSIQEKQDEDDVYLDEEESEEQWRKKRHEREMFLQKQKSQIVDSEDDVVGTSQLLKLGQKFLERSISLNSQNSSVSEQNKPDPTSPLKAVPFSILNKRGSFLNRTDRVLERVAEYTKDTTINSGSKKTTKHFLFQSSAVIADTAAATESKKRKAAEGTPNVIKKLRLNTNLSPAFKKRVDKSERSKKLFNF